EVQVSLGPQVRKGEIVFRMTHFYASFNDTFVHFTNLFGKETISPMNLEETGSSVGLRFLARSSMQIGHIKEVTPIRRRSDSTRRKVVAVDCIDRESAWAGNFVALCELPIPLVTAG
uniref:Uncharacterized protein n=1 Tax=Culex quinquefasciatus TaxID=7176 RepID=A0A1S4JF36_CULQU